MRFWSSVDSSPLAKRPNGRVSRALAVIADHARVPREPRARAELLAAFCIIHREAANPTENDKEPNG